MFRFITIYKLSYYIVFFMGRQGGNPDIRNVIRTGPKTEIGRARIGLNALKTHEDATEDYNEFILWIKKKTGKEIREIIELEELYTVLKTDFISRSLDKILDGKPLSIIELQEIKLLRDTLEVLNKVKYGTKITTEKKITFEDITKTYQEAKKVEETVIEIESKEVANVVQNGDNS